MKQSEQALRPILIPTNIGLNCKLGMDCNGYYKLAVDEYNRSNVENAIIEMHKAINLADQYHPLIHFQGSHLYFDMAQIAMIMGNMKKAEEYSDKAVFFDHNNEAAKMMKNEVTTKFSSSDYSKSSINILDYHNKIKLSQQGFLFEASPEKPKTIAGLSSIMVEHDRAMNDISSGDLDNGFNILLELTKNIDNHENDETTKQMIFHHLGQAYARQENWGKAKESFEQAKIYDKILHESYHMQASRLYYDRGCFYFENNEDDMAINDFNKALYLDKNNMLALQSRLELNKKRNNRVEAEIDMQRLEQMQGQKIA